MEHEPENIDAVQRLVQAARASKVPLYPISRGLNWGYGSRSPVVAGSELVNLGRMNRILNADQISLDNPVAVIEPGVTQGQLYDFLAEHCPQLTFNVTGSSRDTSILGNALDRGVGYFGPRREDLFGLEVVCGSGQVLRTGFRRLGEQSPLAHSHPYGLGPMLDGLFFQGNFGIVTSACFRLVPRRPREVAISLALLDEKNLGRFLDELARLKRDRLLTSVTHVANRARSHATLAFGIATYLERRCGAGAEQVQLETTQSLSLVAPFEWTSLAAVTGNKGQVRAALAEIGKRLGKLAQIRHVTTTKLNVAFAVADRLRALRRSRLHAAALSAIRPLHALALGVPTDVAIENLLWKYGRTDLAPARLDESNCGLLFINPALPMDGEFVASIVEEFKHVAQRYGHELYVTLNIETESSMVAVINLLFNRDQPAEVAQAHRCADALLEHIRSRGLELYRARTDHMEGLVAADPDHWATVRALKEVLDPDNIIAPGRYNLAQ